MSSKLQHLASSEATMLGMLRRQYMERCPPLPTTLTLTQKTGIITGSNVGLGLESAKHLLSHKLSHLILAVRSQSKGDSAASLLKKQFPDARIEVWILDMERYESVRAFGERCRRELGRVHLVVLNAGLAVKSFRKVEGTGRETTIQVNYLSTALLAILLLPLLRPKSVGSGRISNEKRKEGETKTEERQQQDQDQEPGRLTFVGSDTVYSSKFTFPPSTTSKGIIESVDIPDGYHGFEQYKISKLFLIAFVARLGELVSGEEDVIINVAWPGLCKGTAFVRKPDGTWAMRVVVRLLGKEAAVGARGIVDAVVVRGVESHGGIVSEGRVKAYPEILYGESGQQFKERLWEETIKEFESIDGVKETVDEMKK